MPPAQARLLQTFLSRSRCLALARGATLPAESHGTCMFADISGFTPLTEALIHQGYSLTALRKLQETVGAYQGVPGLYGQTEQPDRVSKVLVGLVRVRLAQGQVALAMETVEQILPGLRPALVDNAEEGLRVYLSCIQALQAAGYGRAAEWLRAVCVACSKNAPPASATWPCAHRA